MSCDPVLIAFIGATAGLAAVLGTRLVLNYLEMSAEMPPAEGTRVFQALRERRVSPPRMVEYSAERGYYYAPPRAVEISTREKVSEGATLDATVDMGEGVVPGHRRYCECEQCWERLRVGTLQGSVSTQHWD